jgi:hypothetical protein
MDDLPLLEKLRQLSQLQIGHHMLLAASMGMGETIYHSLADVCMAKNNYSMARVSGPVMLMLFFAVLEGRLRRRVWANRSVKVNARRWSIEVTLSRRILMMLPWLS